MKIIVITGSSDGIGAELARQWAASGKAEVGLVLAARNANLLTQVAAQCRALGAQTLVVKTDVGVQADCRALIAQTMAKFGRIDALINNAGISAQALF
jgi:NADP-dependent 3-hydroxy acid dehydrogenase YdfG